MLPLRRCFATVASSTSASSTESAVSRMARGVLAGDRAKLAEAITLGEINFMKPAPCIGLQV